MDLGFSGSLTRAVKSRWRRWPPSLGDALSGAARNDVRLREIGLGLHLYQARSGAGEFKGAVTAAIELLGARPPSRSG